MDPSQNENFSPYILNSEDQPKLFELLKKVLEFIKIYPELIRLLNSDGEDILVTLEKLLDDTEINEWKQTELKKTIFKYEIDFLKF